MYLIPNYHLFIAYFQVYTFCDSQYELPSGETNKPDNKTVHDVEANHRHNDKCNRRSAWQVLREHPDFDEGILIHKFCSNVDFMGKKY